jgi:tetratricopeptide (TPR) repeat protein
MHRIIAEVATRKLEITANDLTAIENVFGILHIDQSNNNLIERIVWAPYGQIVLDRFPSSETLAIATLQNNQAIVLKEMGDYEEALPLCRKALEIFKKTLPEGHPNIGVVAGNVQAIERAMGHGK